MIRYLEQQEKFRSRELWQEAFPEDSESFADYYYEHKVKDNRILVKEEDGRIVSMLHLNPYMVQVKKQIYKLDYIVGVATAADCRKQGHMRDLLYAMLGDLYQEQTPFTFLMPADRRIYEPFDFTYIFDQPKWKLRPEFERRLGEDELKKPIPKKGGLLRRPWQTLSELDIQRLSDWVNGWLAARFQVYCKRDEAYMERLARELASEDGYLELLYLLQEVNGQRWANMTGLYGEWGLKQREVRTLLCGSEYIQDADTPKPAIMARIVDLKEMLRSICLRRGWKAGEPEEECLGVCVIDHIIKDNQGDFIWHLNREGSWLEPVEDAAGRDMIFHEVSIAQLAGWLFGYEVMPGWMEAVEPLRGVYLDEVV